MTKTETNSRWRRGQAAAAILAVFLFTGTGAQVLSQETLPWKRGAETNQADTYERLDAPIEWDAPSYRRGDQPAAGRAQNDEYGAGRQRADNSRYDDGYGSGSAYNNGPPLSAPRRNDTHRGDAYRGGAGRDDAYRDGAYSDERRFNPPPQSGYGEPYRAPGEQPIDRYEDAPRDRYAAPQERAARGNGYSQDEIVAAGHGFFGSVSKGLASVVEYAFQKSGRPNGYILGEDAGGAFVAGLRYGEGILHTRDYPPTKVYWQGPSLGYDFGAEGSRTMVLVYNLRHPSDIYHRFGGVQGSAYLVGGVSIQYQSHKHVTLAPIRSGLGVRLGANVGYLKYTRSPTWNPF